MRFRIAVLLTSIAAAAAAQDKPVRTPLQIATPISNFLGGVIAATVNLPANPAGTRFVIEHVNARCQFNFNTNDRAGEILLNTVDAKGNLHQYNLVVRHSNIETPDAYDANLSYVSEAIRTYHDGGTAGASPVQIVFRFSGFGLRYPTVCRAELSGYTVATQSAP